MADLSLTQQVNLFYLLADVSRLRIMLRLANRASNVTSLCAALRLRQQNACYHLSVLRLNRLVVSQRRRREVFYALAPNSKGTAGKLKVVLPPCCVTIETGMAAVSHTGLTEVANILGVLSEPIRLRTMLALARGQRNPTSLWRELGVRRNLVSHHLQVLRINRLVVRRRTGKEVFYTLASRAMGTVGKLTISVAPYSVTIEGA